MIFTSVFAGDDNRLLKDAQDDLYMVNVWRLFDVARNMLVLADRILEADSAIAREARFVTTIDHRVLQDAHDILAAAYRYYHDDGGQLDLLDQEAGLRERYGHQWNDWLMRELDELARQPEYVRSVVQAVVFTNTEPGYIAEKMVCSLLVRRYGMASWATRYAELYRVPEA